MIFYKSAFERGRAEQYALWSIINTKSYFRHTVTPFDNFPIIVQHIFSTFSILFRLNIHIYVYIFTTFIVEFPLKKSKGIGNIHRCLYPTRSILFCTVAETMDRPDFYHWQANVAEPPQLLTKLFVFSVLISIVRTPFR